MESQELFPNIFAEPLMANISPANAPIKPLIMLNVTTSVFHGTLVNIFVERANVNNSNDMVDSMCIVFWLS